MKKLIIIAVVAFLVFSGAIGTIIGVVNTPERVAASALTNAFEDLAKRDELAPLSKVLTEGSIALSIEDDGLYELMEAEGECEIGGKIYFSKDAVMLDELIIRQDDLSVSGSLYFSEDLIYVENEEILDGAWGLKRGELADSWADSVFAPDSDSDMALDEDTFNMVGELLKALDDNLDKDMAKDLEKVSERYVKKAWKLICEYAEFESETDEIRMNGQRKDARVITITLDAEAVASIVEDMCNYILEDDKLADLVEKYGDRFANMLEDYAEIEDVSEAYEDLLVQLEENMDEMIDGIEESMENELVVTIATPKLSSDLLMLQVSYDRTDYVTIEFGHKGIRKTDCITVDIYEGVEIVYEITEDSKDDFEAELTVDDRQVATLAIDKDKKEYELELVDLFAIEGTLESKSGVTRISIDTVKADGEKYHDLGIVLTLDEKDKMPAPAKKVESILSITMEDIENWGEKLEEFGAGIEGEAYPEDTQASVLPTTQVLEGQYTNGEGVFIEFYKDETFYAYIANGDYESVSCTGYYSINGDELSFSIVNTNEYINEWDMMESYTHTVNGDGSIYIRGLRMFRYVG